MKMNNEDSVCGFQKVNKDNSHRIGHLSHLNVQ